MKVFELHFNPKKKQDSIFESFVYEAEDQKENKLGNLCMAGELTKALPQNNDFLNNLSAVIKNDFYGKEGFSEALGGVNDFLEKEAKSGNVNWLGNLNFAVLNIGNSILNFTKVGDIKILLLREGEFLDISQNLELQDQEPYPMKVFSNAASGKLLAQDKIIILTNEIFRAISRNEAFLNQLNHADSEKEIKNIFKLNKDVFSEISGLCLLIAQTHELNIIGRQTNMGFAKLRYFSDRIPKRVILIIFFILTLTAAYFLFGGKNGAEINKSDLEKNMQDARSKISMAENFIIIKKEEKAQALFQEAWDILSPIKTKEAASLRESIKKYIISVQP